MKLLEFFLSSPASAALGWTLLHSLWEGAILSGVLAGLLLLLRSARARYLAADGAMLALLGAFAFTLFRVLPGSAGGPQLLSVPHFPAWPPLASGSGTSSWEGQLAELVPWLALFWIAGVLLMYSLRLAGCLSARRLRGRGVCSAPGRWQSELVRLRARLRISRPVRLLESALAEFPMVLGHFRPVILIPVGLLAGLPPGQVEALLLHELAHIRRNDYLVNVLQRFVEALLFYHPAAWWFSRVMRAERENCCDDIVVSICGDAREYAVALAALEQNRLSAMGPALAVTGGNLMKRIRRLLDPRPHDALAPLLAVAVLAATAAVTLAAWHVKTPRPLSPAVLSKEEQALPAAYSQWIDGPVSYLITSQERGAFLRLATNEERDMFIQQFWVRRNPQPGSARNDFKEEFYRRVAYANQHFASGVPGWKTDRGYIYIAYGPPDEIAVRKGPAPGALAMQVWNYRRIKDVGDNGSITFVDRTGRGDFRIAPGTGGVPK